MQTCSFCDPQTITTQMITENTHAFALLPKHPLTKGHIMIIPKRHTALFTEISAEEFTDIQYLIHKLVPVFATYTGATGFQVINNNGTSADQHIPHVHFHVFYRTPEDTSPFDKTARQEQLTNEALEIRREEIRKLFENQ